MQTNGFLVMGVSGSGKTVLGRALARELGWDFLDADDFHPPENIARMKAGIPLNDLDRVLWLALLHEQLEGIEGIALIYLKGTYELIWSRMPAREGHFMKPEMLQSQFDALEEPENALILDVLLPLEDMIDKIIQHYFGSEELMR